MTPGKAPLWERMFENSETDANLLITDDGSILFYYNRYADNILRERKLGVLQSLTAEGEENWSFTFPEYSCLYFKYGIIRNGDILYIAADSKKEHDSGFERGLYGFDTSGGYLWHYAIRAAGKPAVDNKGNVYVFDDRGCVYAINQKGRLQRKGTNLSLAFGNHLMVEDEPTVEWPEGWEQRKPGRLRAMAGTEDRTYFLSETGDKGKTGQVCLICVEKEEGGNGNGDYI